MLDTLTLIAVNALVSVLTAILVAIVWREPTPYPGMRDVRRGLVLVAGHFVLQSLRTVLPLPLVVSVSVPLLLAGGALAVNGAALVMGKSAIMRWTAPVGIAIVPPLAYFLFVEPSTPVRAAILSAWSAANFAIFLSAALSNPGAAGRRATRGLLMIVSAANALADLVRAILIVRSGFVFDVLAQTPINAVISLIYTFNILAFGMLCLQLVSERLRDDLATAREKLAQELEREREQAMIQRSFVSMASHQFRTPLSVIDINAQLLEPRGSVPVDPDELRLRLRKIRHTVTRMVGLMEVMLGAATAETGRIDLKRRQHDLRILVAEAVERAHDTAPDRRFDIALDALPAAVMCDGELIEQVIGNLISNAIKYAPATEPIVVTGSRDGGFAVLSVADRGIGIAAEDQAHIFERFFRGRNVGAVAGTGIGLTLSSYIVDLHGGTIAVASAPGEGATFTLRLPIGAG